MRNLQVIVVSFNLRRGEPVAVGHEPVTSVEAGTSKARLLSPRFDGVGVYGVFVDDDTLDATDLHELCRFGHVPDLDALQSAA